MSNENKKCKVHYTGTFNDGTQFDSSYDRGEPLEFVCGAGMMIKGFDEAVKNMEVGQIVDIHLMPEEAYGMPNPENVFKLEISQQDSHFRLVWQRKMILQLLLMPTMKWQGKN